MAAPFNWHWTQWIMERRAAPGRRTLAIVVAPALHVKTISRFMSESVLVGRTRRARDEPWWTTEDPIALSGYCIGSPKNPPFLDTKVQ